MVTRRYAVNLIYNGVQATSEISPYLNSFTYTDALDESDTVSLNLTDREGRWAAGWIPQKEDRLSAEIVTENWNGGKEQKRISCGDFMVDDFRFSGPPDMLSISGISSPLNLDFKETRRYKTWAEATLFQIASEISGRYGLECVFEGADIPILKAEQSGQADGDFLKKTAQKYGFGMKTSSGRIILFEYALYESKAAEKIIRKSDVRKWDYKSTMLGTYTGAKVSYTNPGTKETVEILVGKEGRLYKTNEKADNMADAERIGQNALRNANRKETTFSACMLPVTELYAGENVNLSGFGKMDGRYQIGKVLHQVGTGDYSLQISGWRLPEEAADEPKEDGQGTAGQGTYVVQSGDTLWELSERFYGSPELYGRLYQANREVIDREAKRRGKADSRNGYWIFPGTELEIPEG